MKTFTKHCTLALAILLSSLAFNSAHAKDSNKGNANYDTQFLEAMSEHHRDGIKMMQMAEEKATSAEIRMMAEKGIDEQSAEIDKMQSLRQTLEPYAPAVASIKLPGMMPKQAMAAEMQKLESATGGKFDRAFLQTMIKHHKGAVKMSDDALLKAKDNEVKEIASAIHDKQKREISRMNQMLKSM